MRKVNLQYAKAHLDHLVDEAFAGEEILIAQEETRLVRLSPVAPRKERVFGLDQGKFEVPEDFDDPMPELEQLFFGGADDPD